MAAYTCYSDDFLSCGAVHRDKDKAAACCRIAARQHGERRAPKFVATNDEANALPVFPAAAERRERFLAERKRKGSRKRSYDPVDELANAGPSADAEVKTAVDGSSVTVTATPKTSAGSSNVNGAANANDALAGLAAAIAPLVNAKGVSQEDLDDIAKQAIAGAIRAAGSLVDEKLRGVDTAAIQRAAEDADKRVTDALAKIDEARVLAVKVNKAAPRKIDGAKHELLETLIRVVASGDNAFLAGPAGSGKTTAAQQVAEALGFELFIQPVCTDKFEALGFIDAGGTYRESAVYRWAKSKKPALLLLDEIDSWDPAALVALNPIIDNKLGIFPGGQQFAIDARHRVMSTANTWGTGATADYCGRNRLDAASVDRFGARLEWGYDERFELKIAVEQFGAALTPERVKQLVAASQKVREKLAKAGVRIVWGPRQTLGIVRRIAGGMDAETALKVSALSTIPVERRKAILEGVSFGE